MSVNWSWDGKCGEITVSQRVDDRKGWEEYKVSVYNGNCLAVFLYEFIEDGEEKYNFWSFFSDKDHAKNCLGLSKGANNIFDTPYQRITKIRLNKKKCRYFKDLVALFAQAFDNISIEVYTE